MDKKALTPHEQGKSPSSLPASLVPLAAPSQPASYPVRQVIPEDEYLAGLSQIIERDFYPDLPRLEAQQAYLQALEAADWEALKQASRRLEQLDSCPNHDLRLSLEEFQASYVGDDDAAFEQIIQRMNEQRRRRLTNLQQMAGRLEGREMPRLLPAPPSASVRINRQATRLSQSQSPSTVDPLSHFGRILAEHGRHAGDEHTRLRQATTQPAFNLPEVSSRERSGEELRLQSQRRRLEAEVGATPARTPMAPTPALRRLLKASSSADRRQRKRAKLASSFSPDDWKDKVNK